MPTTMVVEIKEGGRGWRGERWGKTKIKIGGGRRWPKGGGGAWQSRDDREKKRKRKKERKKKRKRKSKKQIWLLILLIDVTNTGAKYAFNVTHLTSDCQTTKVKNNLWHFGK